MNKLTELTIMRMPSGGFVVINHHLRNQGYCHEFLFAATTIEEAMKYVKRELSE